MKLQESIMLGEGASEWSTGWGCCCCHGEAKFNIISYGSTCRADRIIQYQNHSCRQYIADNIISEDEKSSLNTNVTVQRILELWMANLFQDVKHDFV
jgi:hypothetical protein